MYLEIFRNKKLFPSEAYYVDFFRRFKYVKKNYYFQKKIHNLYEADLFRDILHEIYLHTLLQTPYSQMLRKIKELYLNVYEEIKEHDSFMYQQFDTIILKPQFTYKYTDRKAPTRNAYTTKKIQIWFPQFLKEVIDKQYLKKKIEEFKKNPLKFAPYINFIKTHRKPFPVLYPEKKSPDICKTTHKTISFDLEDYNFLNSLAKIENLNIKRVVTALILSDLVCFIEKEKKRKGGDKDGEVAS